MSRSVIPKRLRTRIFNRDRGYCRYCMLVQFGQSSVFHINHVVPRSKGGATLESNLVLQCPSCSLHKSNKTSAIDPRSEAVVSLFHPLTQVWSDHFLLHRDGRCLGRTSIGRATVDALGMNYPRPRAARALQIAIGLLEPS